MRESFVDLHIHSRFSDGAFSPKEIVEKAIISGLCAVSITDHDSISGLKEGEEEARKAGIGFVPGVELSAEENGREVHILGYFVEWRNLGLEIILKELTDFRHKRAERIIGELKKMKLDVSFEELKTVAEGSSSLGRMHVAQLLIRKGIVDNINEAFNEYIGEGKSAYVPKKKLSPSEAIRIIVDSGGIPALAHPGLTKMDFLIDGLVGQGLEGIEAFHSDHSNRDVKRYVRIAEENKLLLTGGSDFHGFQNDTRLLGKIRIDKKYYDILKYKKYGKTL